MQIAVSTILNDANISICLLATDLSELELQAGSIATMIKQQQALEEKQAELEEANASLRNSRLAALNLMQDAVESRHQLEESTRSLQRAHDELEQRVTERTMDLEIAVETIQTEIAERLKVMEELRMQEQMLLQQSRLAAMGEMINNIAHQWRQPLNALGLLVQKLPIYYDSAEFNREFLEENTVKSMKLIQHMSQTINDFRDFFRSDKEMVAFNLDSVVRQAVAFIEQNFRDLDIKIDLDTEQGLMVKGYPNEFAQALLNILMNACDALVGNNTADARIILRTFEDNGSAVVTVTDNAGGIPGEVIDRVFDPYFTTKGPDKGTGLGLFMSKTIIEKNMAGRLTVRNTGNGAEFRIEVAHDDK
jgi:C4-dicarboxylate-specific signal transduction histidine kinase